MNLIWRFIFVTFISLFQKKIKLFETTSVHFHVLPTDLDILFHMNNGRYLSLADVARTNYLIRSEYFSIWRKYNIIAVIASEMIRFKKSLNLFQGFDIITEMLGWDDKFFYLVHYFKVENHLHACCIVKERCLREGNTLSPVEVLKLAGHTEPSPPLPEWISNWLKADGEFYEESIRKKF